MHSDRSACGAGLSDKPRKAPVHASWHRTAIGVSPIRHHLTTFARTRASKCRAPSAFPFSVIVATVFPLGKELRHDFRRQHIADCQTRHQIVDFLSRRPVDHEARRGQSLNEKFGHIVEHRRPIHFGELRPAGRQTQPTAPALARRLPPRFGRRSIQQSAGCNRGAPLPRTSARRSNRRSAAHRSQA